MMPQARFRNSVPMALLLAGLTTFELPAQWPRYPSARVPRDKQGKPNLRAPAPRTPEGRPDLSGIWGNPPCRDTCPPGSKDEFLPLPAQFVDISWGLKGGLPYRPWAKELYELRAAANGKDNPDARCQPIGLVQLQTHPYPRRILQTPELLVILNEKDNVFRQIHTDGRALPSDPQPWYYGYSTGKWVGDALVAETIGFKEDGWLDFRGAPITEAAKITERFRRPDFGSLEIEITIDDPKAYTRPFRVKLDQSFLLDVDVFEFFCAENEKSVVHFK